MSMAIIAKLERQENRIINLEAENAQLRERVFNLQVLAWELVMAYESCMEPPTALGDKARAALEGKE